MNIFPKSFNCLQQAAILSLKFAKFILHNGNINYHKDIKTIFIRAYGLKASSVKE